MMLNNIGEVLLNLVKIVRLETECKDCFSILASEQEISQCFSLMPLNTGLSPREDSVLCPQSTLLMEAQHVGSGSVSRPSPCASLLSVHLPISLVLEVR